jgi:hypothetical protein
VKLSGKVTVSFVQLGGGYYVQDIKEGRCEDPLEYEIDFSLDTPPQLLALQADHLGIRTVAFRLGKDGKPKFLRDEGSLSDIFVDRVSDGSFASPRLVFDVSI